MKTSRFSLLLAATVVLALGAFMGCESTDDGSSHTSTSVYYGTGFYDPWYYGGYYNDADIIVTPPDRPERPPHVEQPIVRPPTTAPRPTPMPSIPSAPRVAPSGGRR